MLSVRGHTVLCPSTFLMSSQLEIPTVRALSPSGSDCQRGGSKENRDEDPHSEAGGLYITKYGTNNPRLGKQHGSQTRLGSQTGLHRNPMRDRSGPIGNRRKRGRRPEGVPLHQHTLVWCLPYCLPILCLSFNMSDSQST